MIGLHSMILCMHLAIRIGSWFQKYSVSIYSYLVWLPTLMHECKRRCTLSCKIQLQPVLESMCGNTMTSDDDRLSFFSSFFPTPALDISSQKLAPFAFVKKTSLLLALACVAQLWHNGSRSILTEPLHIFMIIRFHEIIKEVHTLTIRKVIAKTLVN